jgi:hypothetical protein
LCAATLSNITSCDVYVMLLYVMYSNIIFMFSSIAGIDGMIAWNLGAFLSFLLVLATWAAEFNIRASALLPIRHTVRTALL